MPLLAKFLSILLYLSVKSGATDLLYGSDDYDGPVFDSFLGKPSAPPVLYNTTSPTNPIPIAITCHTPVGDPNYDPKIYGPKGCQGPWNLSVVACTYEPGGVNGGPGSPAYAQVVDVLSADIDPGYKPVPNSYNATVTYNWVPQDPTTYPNSSIGVNAGCIFLLVADPNGFFNTTGSFEMRQDPLDVGNNTYNASDAAATWAPQAAGLSAGEIAGIVLGSVAGLALAIVIVIFLH